MYVCMHGDACIYQKAKKLGTASIQNNRVGTSPRDAKWEETGDNGRLACLVRVSQGFPGIS